MEEREVVIVGGGPAGYVAAIRAAQLGAKVTLVEEKKLGGTCLNWGCIPTKFWLHAVDVYESIKHGSEYGVNTSGVGFDLAQIQAGKNKVVANHVGGVRGLLRMYKVEVISGRARLLPAKQLEVSLEQGGKQAIQARKIIIATGARPIVLPIPGGDSPDVMDAQDLLDLTQMPESMVIIGGGVIGVEMATVWAKLGCKVSIVEMMPHCLPTQDAEIAAVLEGALKQDGVQIYCGSRVSRIDDIPGGKAVVFTSGGAEQKIETKAVAMSVGYRANVKDLGLEECGITVNRGCIQVNNKMETNVPDIYAAGDVVGGMMLAYVAFVEGKVAAENAMGMDSTIDYHAVPQCIFTMPEVASVGLTEEQAIAEKHEIKIGRFPFAANGMASILGEHRGLVKLIAEAANNQILGVHIIGPRATLLIPEAALAIKQGLTTREIIATMHAHPTLSEAVWEAALDVTGDTIHARSRNKR
ncbi:MAG: dihydrolipoyl dehydrogenase [Dehalococcoidales bacterium]|nr:dihydrolipoyl dehydrogenase [Dehalococcoidales bacterium]